MYSRTARLAFFLAGTSVGATYHDQNYPDPEPTTSTSTTVVGNGYAPGRYPTATGHSPVVVSSATGVLSPSSYGTGVPSIITDPVLLPTYTPGGDVGPTTDNCMGFTSAGISITCAATPDVIPTGDAQHPQYPAPSEGVRNHYRRRLRPIEIDNDYDDEYPPSPTDTSGGHTGKRPICYKYILPYEGDHGPVAPQQFPCYQVGEMPGQPTWQYGSGHWPQPTPAHLPYGEDVEPTSVASAFSGNPTRGLEPEEKDNDDDEGDYTEHHNNRYNNLKE